MKLLEHFEFHTYVPIHIGGIDLSINQYVLWMLISCSVLVILFRLTISLGGGLIPKGAYNISETLIEFVRDQIVIPNIGKKDSKTWLPFICTLFLFILANNLLGLIPGSATATSNINVTGTLAVLVFVIVQYVGVKKFGLFKHMGNWVPSGMPVIMSIVMFPLECISQIAKPFSLAVRLFANMFAGHAVLLVFLNLIIMGGSYLIGVLPFACVVGISVLEVGFAMLQAFIFTILASMYIGDSLHGGH